MTDSTLNGPILIVEDEWLIGDMVQTMLQEAGYDTIGPSASVADARSLIDEFSPAFVVLDINLGAEQSFAIVDLLTARGVGYVLVSGYGSADLPSAYRHCPLVEKPLTSDGLISTVRRLIGNHQRVDC
ncbi:MAG: response regulator [Novosphingobium sp.]